MKKRLEAELISIAHRILKLKNKSELNQLYTESRKLYETLSVLKFVEDNVHAIEPKISVVEIEKMIYNAEINTDEVDTFELEHEAFSVRQTDLNSKGEEIEASNQESILIVEEPSEDAESDGLARETLVNMQEELLSENETVKPIIIFEPLMDYSAEFVKKEITDIKAISIEEKPETDSESIEKPQTQQISFEDLLGYQVEEPQFEKKADYMKPATLNQMLAKNSTLGLNDRIGFVKYLFDGSEEDFNRVLSQTGTLDNAAEVNDFINNLVKPDYNNWENKDGYEARFMEVILSRFN